MFVSTPSGFADTPITRRIVFFTAVIPIIVGILEIQYLFDLSLSPQLLIWNQWWRIPLNQLTYVDQAHVLLGLVLFYNLRVIERLMGSRKFLSYIFLIYCGSICIIPLLLAVFSIIPILKNIDYIPPGQTSIIFALLVLYHRMVPPMYRCQLTTTTTTDFKAEFTDKALVYAISIQLCLFYPPGTSISALTGWVLGELIYSEIIPGKNWRFPFYHKLGLEESSSDTTPSSQQQQGSSFVSGVLDNFRATG